jgi:hypothetical protein
MEHALRIGSGSDYVPTTTDVLRARAKSVGIAETRYVILLFRLDLVVAWRATQPTQSHVHMLIAGPSAFFFEQIRYGAVVDTHV